MSYIFVNVSERVGKTNVLGYILQLILEVKDLLAFVYKNVRYICELRM